MKKSLQFPANDPPPVEYEVEVEEEEEEESETDDDAVNGKMNSSSPPPSVSKKPETETSSALEDEESGSSSESDSDSEEVPYILQPVASKRVTHPVKTTATPAAKKPSANPTSSIPGTSAGARTKRAATELEVQAVNANSKRAKTKAADHYENKGNVDEEKKLFARVFSEEDEIVILKGMADFFAKTKMDPLIKINEFHDLINERIGSDKTKVQLLDKMKRLKKRYEKHADKALRSGKVRTLSNPHEQNVYDLSKLIWGNEENAGDEETSGRERAPKGSKKNAIANSSEVKKSETGVLVEVEELKKKKSFADVKKKGKSFSFFPSDDIFNSDWYLQEGKVFLEEQDRVEMEAKWKDYKLQESQLLMMKSKLMLEHLEKVQKGMESYGN